MKILYIHQYFAPPCAPASTRSFEFIKRLIAKGHHVRLITSRAHLRASDIEPQAWGIDHPDALELSVVNVSYSNSMGYAERLRVFLKFAVLASARVRHSPVDIVFATSTPLTVALPGMVAKRLLHAPFVFEVRDLWPEIPIAIGALKTRPLIWVARQLERVAYKTADEIVALSPGMREKILSSGVETNKVSVIPNACDNKFFEVGDDSGASFRAGIPGMPLNRPLLIYAGAFGRINGVGYLVRLAAALRAIGSGLGVVLVGDGAERAAVVKDASENGLFGQGVWVVDPVPKRDMPKVLAAATVCASVFAPIKEMEDNSANKFFDYLAAGRPVAINYGGWQAELLENTGAGIVLPPNDIHAAAERLQAFVSDPVTLAAAGRAARRLAEERFDRERLADQFEAVLMRAVARGRR